MLHNRQAPGRDFHEHFSLAPARSDTNPPSNPQFRYAMCGELLQEDWEVDHVLSLQRGGSNDLSNLQALHKRCHAYKNHVEQRG